jgi:hypothetical protein
MEKLILFTAQRKHGLRINLLTDDYLDIEREVHLFDVNYESPAMLKRNGVYFVFASNLTGWYPNDNKYTYAESLSGPWSEWQNFAPANSYTYDSQVTYVLALGGDDDAVIYMGDRWTPTNLMRSTYVWLPLQFSGPDGTRVTLENRVSWVPHAHNGTWSPAPVETDYEAEKAVLRGGVVEVECSRCSGDAAAGYTECDAGKGSIEFYGINSQQDTRSTMRIIYTNEDSSERFARVTTNNVTRLISFLPTGGEGELGSASVHADLRFWLSNPIIIEGVDGECGPDIDRIFVPNY